MKITRHLTGVNIELGWEECQEVCNDLFEFLDDEDIKPTDSTKSLYWEMDELLGEPHD